MLTKINIKLFLLSVISFCFLNMTLSQTNKSVTDFLGVPGPLLFNTKSYILNWSAHPNANYYKQEYLVKSDRTDKYNTMLLLDVITGKQDLKDIVNNKIAEIKKMKETNPIINYEIIHNPKTDEYILDFLLTANAADGSISILERNVYRYKSFIDKAGNKSAMLFGVSVRAYGASAANQFLISLKSNRKDLINKVSQYKIASIKITK